jgi:hypothetical protein
MIVGNADEGAAVEAEVVEVLAAAAAAAVAIVVGGAAAAIAESPAIATAGLLIISARNVGSICKNG